MTFIDQDVSDNVPGPILRLFFGQIPGQVLRYRTLICFSSLQTSHNQLVSQTVLPDFTPKCFHLQNNCGETFKGDYN